MATRTTRGRRARSIATGALALALAATVSACGGGGKDADAQGGPAGTAAPKKGGSLTILLPYESRGLDPFTSAAVNTADGPRVAALYDPMFYVDPATGQVKPHIGEALGTEDGGKTWTLKLRDGVKFSDGTPYNAEAVKFFWERHADPATQSSLRAPASGLQMEVVDPLTLKVTLPAPNPHFDKVVANQLGYIGSPTAYQKDPKAFAEHPVGAGPFVLKEWVHGSQQTYERNPTYWQGADKPALDKLVIKFVPDIFQQLATVNAGGADMFTTIAPDLVAKARDARLGVTEAKISGGQYVAFNSAKPPFDDPRARKFVSLALDPADLNKIVFEGKGVPAKSLFSQNSPWFDASAAFGAPNRDEAQKLADQLAAEGKPLEFTFNVQQSPNSQQVAEYLQSRLGAFKGVTVKVEVADSVSTIIKTRVQRQFQAVLHQSWMTEPEPALYEMLHSGPLNWFGYTNPAVDAALEQGRATTDPAARKAAYAEVMRQVVADVPVFTYQEAVSATVHSRKVTGIQMYNDGLILMDRIGLAG